MNQGIQFCKWLETFPATHARAAELPTVVQLANTPEKFRSLLDFLRNSCQSISDARISRKRLKLVALTLQLEHLHHKVFDTLNFKDAVVNIESLSKNLLHTVHDFASTEASIRSSITRLINSNRILSAMRSLTIDIKSVVSQVQATSKLFTKFEADTSMLHANINACKLDSASLDGQQIIGSILDTAFSFGSVPNLVYKNHIAIFLQTKLMKKELSGYMSREMNLFSEILERTNISPEDLDIIVENEMTRKTTVGQVILKAHNAGLRSGIVSLQDDIESLRKIVASSKLQCDSVMLSKSRIISQGSSIKILAEGLNTKRGDIIKLCTSLAKPSSNHHVARITKMINDLSVAASSLLNFLEVYPVLSFFDRNNIIDSYADLLLLRNMEGIHKQNSNLPEKSYLVEATSLPCSSTMIPQFEAQFVNTTFTTEWQPLWKLLHDKCYPMSPSLSLIEHTSWLRQLLNTATSSHVALLREHSSKQLVHLILQILFVRVSQFISETNRIMLGLKDSTVSPSFPNALATGIGVTNLSSWFIATKKVMEFFGSSLDDSHLLFIGKVIAVLSAIKRYFGTETSLSDPDIVASALKADDLTVQGMEAFNLLERTDKILTGRADLCSALSFYASAP